ncbi:MAG: redoxin domain-containing protein [Acidipropionibacterium jensenii]|nr:redoxin domain-containing protein [Acidipropionibacterium acidipropionici]MDN6660083.1 redoxin domain-containing protein [Acidipropionibacterium jensenii]MDN6812760.1 redoxin domain-containing protein [Corynebacterium variabile]
MDAFDLLDSAGTIETALVPESADDLATVRDLYRSAPPMDGLRVTTGLEPGTPAPDFALPAADGTIVRLSELRGSPVALVFYPLDWSPGCSVQLELYQQEHDEFASRGIQLLGISVDSIYSHGAWAAVRGIRYPLLSDFQPRGETARAYNVWRNADGHSERALYLIDAQGIIRWTHVSERLKELPDFDELVAALDLVADGEHDDKEVQS